MGNSTRATASLVKAGVVFTVHPYPYDPTAEQIGLQAADALGEDPDRVLKTLMALVDSKPVCAIIASDREVSMKRLASAFGGKTAAMMRPAEAERISGYVVGGISPFGQKRMLPTAMDETALRHEFVYVNGGQRGLQLRLSPADVARVTTAFVVPLAG